MADLYSPSSQKITPKSKMSAYYFSMITIDLKFADISWVVHGLTTGSLTDTESLFYDDYCSKYFTILIFANFIR